MNPQVAITFPAGYVGREAWDRQLEVIRAAVKHLGPKEVTFVLDIGATQLSDALNERDRKVWHAHWTHVLKAMLVAKRDEIAEDLLRQLVDIDVSATPFAITDDAPLTAEEESAALRRELLKFGEAGRTAVARVKARAKR